jgi:3-dehydroquinate synthase
MTKIIKSVHYNVVIGKDSLSQLNSYVHKKRYSKIFILCDENTFKHCLPELLFHCDSLHESELLEIESGEESKNISVCTDLWKSLTESGADRNSLLVNLGGGVISDMGGFVASVFKRGFDFINVPTTLLSMADASVGGKTGIDFDGLKNHIGTITQPTGVFIHTKFLETLEKREFVSGLAEIIKAGLIADKELFGTISRMKNISPKKCEEIIFRSVQIKNEIVKKDPYEKNIRKALNFGHTIGHALESFSLSTSSPLLHGEAVALGMLAESQISCDLNMISKVELKKIQHCIRKFFDEISAPTSNEKLLIELMKQDKKNSGDTINFTLLNEIGHFSFNCFVPESIVIKAIHSL